MPKKKAPTVPTHLALADIVLEPALQVRPVSDEIAEEYAEHVELLPPVIVWDVDGQYLLADGWHRRRAHELADRTEIKVQILQGTLEQAKLYVAMCDVRVGVRRNRAAKRAAVLLVLGTSDGAEWSDRKIGAHCGVSHTFVGLVRARLAAGTGEEGDAAGATAPTAERAEESPEGGNVATVVTRGEPSRLATGGNVAIEVGQAALEATEPSDPQQGAGVAGDPRDGDEATLLGDSEDVDEEPSEPHEPTVNAVLDQVELLLGVCGGDDERRETLGHLLEALTGMLAALEPGEDDIFDAAV